MTYEEDYEMTAAAHAAALRKREELDGQIRDLERRIDALMVLIGGDSPHKGRLVLDNTMSPTAAIVNVLIPSATERVKNILQASTVPLTSGELNQRLRDLGWSIDPSRNPWALIHSMCRRLVDQGLAREVDKDGRKAWVRIS